MLCLASLTPGSIVLLNIHDAEQEIPSHCYRGKAIIARRSLALTTFTDGAYLDDTNA